MKSGSATGTRRRAAVFRDPSSLPGCRRRSVPRGNHSRKGRGRRLRCPRRPCPQDFLALRRRRQAHQPLFEPLFLERTGEGLLDDEDDAVPTPPQNVADPDAVVRRSERPLGEEHNRQLFPAHCLMMKTGGRSVNVSGSGADPETVGCPRNDERAALGRPFVQTTCPEELLATRALSPCRCRGGRIRSKRGCRQRRQQSRAPAASRPGISPTGH